MGAGSPAVPARRLLRRIEPRTLVRAQGASLEAGTNPGQPRPLPDATATPLVPARPPGRDTGHGHHGGAGTRGGGWQCRASCPGSSFHPRAQHPVPRSPPSTAGSPPLRGLLAENPTPGGAGAGGSRSRGGAPSPVPRQPCLRGRAGSSPPLSRAPRCCSPGHKTASVPKTGGTGAGCQGGGWQDGAPHRAPGSRTAAGGPRAAHRPLTVPVPGPHRGLRERRWRCPPRGHGGCYFGSASREVE